MAVDAVVYYKAKIDLSCFVKFIILHFQINNPLSAVCNVTNAAQSTRLLASTTLRNTLGTKTLQVLLFYLKKYNYNTTILEGHPCGQGGHCQEYPWIP